MVKQLFFSVLLGLICAANTAFARTPQATIIDELKHLKPAEDTVNTLRKSLYFHVMQVKNSGTTISTQDKLSLEHEYEALRKQINTLYRTMADEVSIYEKNSAIYAQYKSELDLLIKKSYSYMGKINKALGRNPVGVGTGDLSWVPVVLDIINRIKGEVFFQKIQWKSWKSIR